MRYNILQFVVFALLGSCVPTDTDKASGPNLQGPSREKNTPNKTTKDQAPPNKTSPKDRLTNTNTNINKDLADQAASNKEPSEISKNLAATSNEAVLIQRAADYIVRSKKEAEYLAEIKTAKGRDDINASIETVIKNTNFQDIYNMFIKMLPVHRCDKKTLEGINRLGYFVSTEILHSDMHTSDGIKPLYNLLAKTYTRKDLENIIKHAVVSYTIEKLDPSINSRINFDEPAACTNIDTDKSAPLEKCLAELKFTPDNESKLLTEGIDGILRVPPGGLQYFKDQILGTDKYVFSLLGINRNPTYGNVVIPLDAEVFKSAWSTPVAATFFNNLNPMTNVSGPIYYGAASGRVWVEGKNWASGEAHVDFEHSKIQAGREIIALVSATEMLGRVMAYHRGNEELLDKIRVKKALGEPDPNKSFAKISASEIRKYMEAVESHALIEMHIPPFSTDAIDKVVLPDAVYTLLKLPLKNIPDNKFVQVPFVKDMDQLQKALVSKAESYSAP